MHCAAFEFLECFPDSFIISRILLKSVFCLPLSFYLKDYFFGTILIVLQSVVRIRSIYLKVSACPFGSYAACYLHFLIYALCT